ncbi:MAG: hypothetical protein ABJA34_13520 [Pseudonocardiales bacterium]
MSPSTAETPAPSGVAAAFRKFGDLLALLLIASVALDYLLGLGRLLIGSRAYPGAPTTSPFTERAGFADTTFLSLTSLALVVVAVLLVTVVGGRSRLARPVVIVALALVAIGALLGFISMVAGMFSHVFTTRNKIETLLGLLIVLAIFVVVGMVLLQVLSSPELRPAPKPQPAYAQYQGQQQGYGGYPPQRQQQQVYGYPPQGQYDPQPSYQQHYEQPPTQVGQPYEQQQQAYEPPPPIWEQPPNPPPSQQPSGWPVQPPSQQPPQQASPEQRWPEGNQ